MISLTWYILCVVNLIWYLALNLSIISWGKMVINHENRVVYGCTPWWGTCGKAAPWCKAVDVNHFFLSVIGFKGRPTGSKGHLWVIIPDIRGFQPSFFPPPLFISFGPRRALGTAPNVHDLHYRETDQHLPCHRPRAAPFKVRPRHHEKWCFNHEEIVILPHLSNDFIGTIIMGWEHANYQNWYDIWRCTKIGDGTPSYGNCLYLEKIMINHQIQGQPSFRQT